jgi:three-Cys-motif partner protein
VLSDLYYGREQSQAKHEILGRYLLPFANKILSKWPSIDFIDGFSGPWENNDKETLSDTSIGIALRTLSEVAEKGGHNARNPRIRCIFNEADPKSYALLHAFIDKHGRDYPLLKIDIFQGAFEGNAAKIWRAADHSFQLLFVDPTGYTGFPPSSLALFKGRSSEVIVNFMRSFIERFVSGEHRDRKRYLVGLVGAKRAQYLLDTGVSIESVEDEYLSMLRGDLGYKFAGFSPIHNPDRNEIHFNLVF